MLPEVPGPGEQGTLHCRALQDLFFIRLLSLRAREMPEFPNRHRKSDKRRRQRNVSQMKEQSQTMARDQSKTDISNMPDTEFKAMIIKILTELEKRVEDISETFNTEIKKN